MNNDKIRIAIAESLGWVRHKSENKDFEFVWMRGNEYCFALPNYPEDLNACAEMRKSLSADELRAYGFHLMDILETEDLTRWIFDALPVQHCHAYLRTKKISI